MPLKFNPVPEPAHRLAGFVVGATTLAVGACTVTVDVAVPEHPQEFVAVTV